MLHAPEERHGAYVRDRKPLSDQECSSAHFLVQPASDGRQIFGSLLDRRLIGRVTEQLA
jgi:hypothetical protein